MRSPAPLCGVIGAFLVLAFCGCAASAPLRVGQTYVVQWPDVPIDVVTIEQKYRGGLASCYSVKDERYWVCNFRTALFYTEAATPRPVVADGLRVAK